MMNQILSPQIFIVLLVVVNVFLLLLLWVVLRRISRWQGGMAGMPTQEEVLEAQKAFEDSKAGIEKSSEILDMLESLVVDAKAAAENFEEQIREKRMLSKTLNDALDSRIISINLLLSRAKTLHEKLESQQDKVIQQAGTLCSQTGAPPSRQTSRVNVFDQQQQIIDMYYRKKDVDSIAQALSIPREEVRMVIELKEKFIAMEKTR